MRGTLAFLKSRCDPQGSEYVLEYSQPIKAVFDKEFHELQELSEKGLDLIDSIFLPNVDSRISEVFFLKFKGDIYRYLSEFAEGDQKEQSLTSAEAAYKKGYSIATEHLKKSDPVRLGLILNYAVFLYEHQKKRDSAIDLLNPAIDLADDDYSELTKETADETKSLIEVMQININNWIESED